MQSLLQGLPLQAQSYSYSQPSRFAEIVGGAGNLGALFESYGLPNILPTTADT